MVAARITSPANPRIKAFAKLKKARERANTGLFLIEGEREVERAVAAGVDLETLLVCRKLLAGPLPPLAHAVEVLDISEAPLGKVSLRQNPAGLIAVARQFPVALEGLAVPAAPLVLIVERIEKPGNLGAMMRTADAVGVDAVVVTDAATDVFNPNVVRASQGAVFSVPLAVTRTAAAIAWTQSKQIRVLGGYAAAPIDMWQAPLTGGVAILIGAEDVGVSPAWDGVAEPIRIPMAGAADSLNASVAAAVLLFEAARQRRLD